MAVMAQASRVIAAKPSEIWESLTSREGMKAYMLGVEIVTDWRVGAPIAMHGEAQGEPFEDRGEVRSFLPNRRLSYTHVSMSAPDNPHLVTVELQPRGDVTEVTVTQENLYGPARPGEDEQRLTYEKTWAKMLAGLEKAVAN